MKIIDYFQCEDCQPWLRQIAQYEWSAARFLTELLTQHRFHEAVGEGTLLLLADGDTLVSFLTLAERDCVDAPAWSPWIGFVHTDPAYRGHRHACRLIEHACALAREHGASRAYICTDHDGLYEKYGFTLLEDRVSIYGEMSHVLVRDLAVPDCCVLTADDIRDDSFASFVRRQPVKEAWRMVDGQWKLVPVVYVDDWAPDTRIKRAQYVRSVLAAGGWLAAAMHEGRIIGMALLGRRLGSRMQYIDLDSFHVSAPWRSRGVGRALFRLACEEARRRGAEKLYISAHSARETIAVYFALGCTHAAEIDAQHAADEPCDMQLEYALYAVHTNALDAETFLRLYTAVGWDAPGRDQVQHALDHSLATFLVTDRERPIAMARLLGDLAMSCYIKDFAVLPECQGRGVGRLLMRAVEDYIRQNRPKGWHMSLELMAARGMEGFYRKLGFEERPCEWDGPGMFKMIRE